MATDPRTRFCNRYECRYAGHKKTFSEEVRKQRSEQMKALNERPDVKAKLIAFRASDRAPFKQPETHRKSVEKQREMGFPTLNYGRRDSGPTVPQKMLFDALSGVVMEYRLPKSGKTNSFRVDLAFPSLRLAVEVDGLSHTKRSEKERDARKEEILRERGWALLRFWNKEILDDLSSVLLRIHATATALQKERRLPASPKEERTA